MVENKAFQNEFDHLKKNLIYVTVIDDNICGQVPAFFKSSWCYETHSMSQDRNDYIPDTLSPHQGFLGQNWEALRIS